jgi:hypothetical protein
MGSLLNSNRLAAFNGDVYPKGLDLRRCIINNDPGVWEALSTATIRQGQFQAQDANGYLLPSAGADTVGVAKWNQQTTGVSVNVDEAITMTGTTAQDLARGNVSNVSVRSAQNFTGTLYTVTTDYTVNAANGTVTRVGGGTITDGQVVYVTYTYALTDGDFEIDGRDFRNQSNNDVLGNEGKLALITNWAQLFSIEYDTSVAYAMTGATSLLYVSSEGKVTSASGTDAAGKIRQLPNSTDQFMGFLSFGNPA